MVVILPLFTTRAASLPVCVVNLYGVLMLPAPLTPGVYPTSFAVRTMPLAVKVELVPETMPVGL
ncbi:MAG: hypothetical protein EOO76_08795 [Novosphingobium sp.]|nr:MAG: hypothetical protein EOO76_08795 [Novosphingobium sp.]